MPKTFCLLNHPLTQNQLCELKEKFNSTQVIYPEEKIAKLWSQIPPENFDCGIINDVILWLKENSDSGDYFIVQGEFGSTFMLVDFALKSGLVPLYATTRRVAKESREGESVYREYIFEHVCFKKYRYFKD